ncbi:amino acid ABC transporter substrate-binding protein [Mesorhizobium sp. M7A.F.Ca.US.001.04.1.1]|uniref:amino acid ABC transporter substrate-binding protein n=1 Tax=Mesorhizobium sp. M7A.F.Ca.US.001.04.1.1 TaxID=2496726 RepID=UPI000FCA0AAA|nr:amino acid ABC transporter substrate-binding protein [Mesorhizobium sp. M7A.F.Ca.US.001.04.1.1]RUY39387.1 amino acid ABC transporter substrate-binding protein [Mesorhizobium sp. M7A.F.Ca.US.001.04.1.1]
MIRQFLASAALATFAFCGSAHAGATFDAIKAKGYVQCGVNTGLSGFSLPDSQGRWTGLDVDICKAIAAAVFGDGSKVRFTPLSAQVRFTALQSGEVDVLARNSTWTISRNASLGLDFTGVDFYDGQGFLVRKSLGVDSATKLEGATVCVQPGTTTERNLTDWFRAQKLTFRPVVIENLDEVESAFFSDRCDAYSTDTSALAAAKVARAQNPDDYVILPEVISKEPLSIAVRQGDPQWANVTRAVYNALLQAEESNVTQANVDSFAQTTDPTIQRLLGISDGIGSELGLPDKWGYNAVKAVGNYSEIFERNVGAKTPLGLKRGLNALWTNGGLMYPIPQ